MSVQAGHPAVEEVLTHRVVRAEAEVGAQLVDDEPELRPIDLSPGSCLQLRGAAVARSRRVAEGSVLCRTPRTAQHERDEQGGSDAGAYP